MGGKSVRMAQPISEYLQELEDKERVYAEADIAEVVLADFLTGEFKNKYGEMTEDRSSRSIM